MGQWFKNNLIFFSVLTVIFISCFLAIFITPPLHDELLYHAPLAREISPKVMFSSGSNYSSAYPPLPYLFGKFALRIHPSLESLRLMNLAIFLVTICVFRLIAIRISDSPNFLTLLFALNPYLIKASFTYLMYNWGILFALAGLYTHFFKSSRFLPLSHLMLGLAVLSQQWLLAVVAAILLYEIMALSREEISIGVFVNRVLLKVLFLLPAALLFWNWSGLVHPNFATHSLHPTFEHLNAVLATLGLALGIIVATQLRRIVRLHYIPLIFLLPLLWLAIPSHSIMHGPSVMPGITTQLAVKIAVFSGIPYKITMFVFIMAGLASLCLLLSRKRQNLQQVLVFALLGFIVAFTVSSRLAASHIFICLPFAWLALSDDIKGMGRAKYVLISQFFLLSAVYWIYIVFFRSKEIMF